LNFFQIFSNFFIFFSFFEIFDFFEKFYNFLDKENYQDKTKLSLNVFEDFEKQTSWQSYTTLLITDIKNVADKKELLASKKTGEKTRTLSRVFSKK
jgi:hypothetical protein